MVEINRCKWAECDHTSNVKRPCFKHMVTQCIEREDGALILTRLMLAALFIAQTDRSLSLIFICRIKDLSWFLKRGWDRCDIVVSCQIEEGQVQPFNPVKFSWRLADVFAAGPGGRFEVLHAFSFQFHLRIIQLHFLLARISPMWISVLFATCSLPCFRISVILPIGHSIPKSHIIISSIFESQNCCKSILKCQYEFNEQSIPSSYNSQDFKWHKKWGEILI